MPAASAFAGASVTARQQQRRWAIRLASAISLLIFYSVLFLAPAIGGLITS